MLPRSLPVDSPRLDLEGEFAAYLTATAQFALSDWVLRVANLPAFRADPELDLERLRGEIAPLFEAIVDAILVHDPVYDDEPGTRIAEAAGRHGDQRRKIDIPIGTLLTELHELRQVITRAMSGWAETAGRHPALASLTLRLERAIDTASIAAATSWVAGTAPSRDGRHGSGTTE
ncbi:MAG TPA: hypothetical protein VGT61_10880 [Thermomicrobiales bacterium]|jgi:hypothetical protein|nr:hypothetical protein [Thermomicrobiales bacterium]